MQGHTVEPVFLAVLKPERFRLEQSSLSLCSFVLPLLWFNLPSVLAYVLPGTTRPLPQPAQRGQSRQRHGFGRSQQSGLRRHPTAGGQSGAGNDRRSTFFVPRLYDFDRLRFTPNRVAHRNGHQRPERHQRRFFGQVIWRFASRNDPRRASGSPCRPRSGQTAR